MKAKESFEKQLSEMCIVEVKNEHMIFIGLEPYYRKRYYPEIMMDYLSVKVSADCLRKGLVKLFLEYSKSFASSQKESYYNEPYFFNETGKLLFCLNEDKSKEWVLVDYYKGVIDAFSEIHNKLKKRLDPGFFETMLYSCVMKIDDELKVKEILGYYDKNKKAKFENFPDYCMGNENSSIDVGYYESQMVGLYVDVIKKLGESETIEEQRLYSSLLKNCSSDIIKDVVYYKKGAPLKNVSLLHVDSEITDEIFSDEDLLAIKQYFPYSGSLFDSSINELVVKRMVDDEKVFKVFASRIFNDFDLKALKIGHYTNDSFDDDNFYLNLTNSKIDFIVQKANRFYAAQNKLNRTFTELGFHNGTGREERMKNYLLMRKENAIVKDFTNKLIKEECAVNRKRL